MGGCEFHHRITVEGRCNNFAGVIRAALLDFDGTVVNEDITRLIAGLNGKCDEAFRLNEEFRSNKRPGFGALIDCINLSIGVTLTQVREMLDKDMHLMPGAHEMFAFFKKHDIITILASGTMVPVLEIYQEHLGIDYVIGTSPAMDGETIAGITEENAPLPGFKLTECIKLLTELDIPIGETVALGDSPADRGIILHSGIGIAINPAGGVEEVADHVIGSDLREVIKLLQ